MKIAAAISTLALVATGAVTAEVCSNLYLAAYLPLEEVMACQTTTGYTFIPPTSLPTTSQAKLICTKCPDMLAALATTKLPSCTIALLDGSSMEAEQYYAKISSCTTTPTTTTAPSPAITKTPTTTKPPITTEPPLTLAPAITITPTTSESFSGSNGSFDTPVPMTPQVTGSSMGPIDILDSNTETTKPTTTPRVLPTIASAGVHSVTLGAATVAVACTITGLAL